MYNDNRSNFYNTNASGFIYENFQTTLRKDPATTAFGWGTGALSNDRNFTWMLLDQFPTSAPVVDLDIQGRKAYVGLSQGNVGTEHVQILDIEDPSDINLLSTVTDHDNLYSLAVDGDVMITSQDSMVQDAIVTFNVTDSTNPSWSVGWGLDNKATDIEVDGHLFYYTVYDATDSKSLRILSMQDLVSVNIIRCNWLVNTSLGLDVKGHLAYIAASTDGFYILNVTDKYAPVVYGHVDTPGNATDVLVEGRYAYVVDGTEGLHVIDVFDPYNPQIIGSFNTEGHAVDLAKKGNTLYVADGSGGVTILDVANPLQPVMVDTIPINIASTVDMYGGFLVIGGNDGVFTYKTGFQGNFMADWFANTFDMYEAWDVRVIGDVAYVAAGPDGFYTLNVRDPDNPILLDHHFESGAVFKTMDIRGQFAYCIDEAGVYTFDISDPSNIELTRMEGGTDLEDIVMSGPIAYVVYGDPTTSGFASCNYTYSYGPGFVANNNYGTNVTGICAQGNLIFIGENNGAASSSPHVFSKFPNIFTPQFKGTRVAFLDRCQDIFVDGDILYFADKSYTVIFNVSEPHAPLWQGDIEYPNSGDFIRSNGVWGDGPMIVCGGDEGVFLFDTTNYPLPPVLSGSYCPFANGTKKLVTNGEFTYVANTSNLVILRHFKGWAGTFFPPASLARSLPIVSFFESVVTKATIHAGDYVPVGTSINYFLSADNGVNWEPVTLGVEHTFTHNGSNLLWQAEIIGPEYKSAYIYDVNVEYEYEPIPTTSPSPTGGGFDPTSPLWLGIFIGGGGLILIVLVVVTIVLVNKRKKVPIR